jgi:hypothetical protein
MATTNNRKATRYANLNTRLFHVNKPLLIAPPLHLHLLQKPFKAIIALFTMCISTTFFNPASAQFDGGINIASFPYIIDPLFQFSTPRADRSAFGTPFGWIWGPSDNLLNDGYNIIMRQPSAPSTTPTFSTDFRLSVFGERMVQVSGSGNIGTATGDRWNAIGDRLPFVTSAGFSSNGLRSQWDGFSANFGLSDDPAGGTERHALVQWQDISVTSPGTTTLSRLRFVFRDGNPPVTGGIATEVGTALFDGKWGFGINNIAPLSTVDVKGGLYVGSGATVTANDGDGYFKNSVRVGDDVFTSGASSAAGLIVTEGKNVGLGENNPTEILDIKRASTTVRVKMRNSWATTGATLDLTNNFLSINNYEAAGAIGFFTNSGAIQRLVLHPGGIVSFEAHVIPAQNEVYTSGASTLRWSDVWSKNSFNQTSDKRAKKDIEDLHYGLKELMLLKPVSFRWIENDNKKRTLGFIAQDLNEIISEVVVEPEIQKIY